MRKTITAEHYWGVYGVFGRYGLCLCDGVGGIETPQVNSLFDKILRKK